MTQYWFARRFPLGDPRSAMGPVHWKGFAVSIGFAVALISGAAAWVWLAQDGRAVEGAAIFTVVAFVAGLWFVTTTRQHGDRIKTVADYREEKKRA
jgi:hypothetical protein